MKSLVRVIAICALACAAIQARADVTVRVDASLTWLGYMNVSDLPINGGAYLWGSPWGTADLCATLSGSTLTLTPNAINDPAEYWYQGGGAPGAVGNKIMDANYYIEDSSALPGQLVTFTGEVLTNTLSTDFTSRAFIKDFAADYSSFNFVYADLTPGTFSISLQTVAEGHHTQYGFETVGPCVWITDLASKGSVTIVAVNTAPPPTALRALRIAAGLDSAPTPATGADFTGLNAVTSGDSATVIDLADAVALAKAGKI